MMSEEELEVAIIETEKQEALFVLAGDYMEAAWWVCERIKLRGLLYARLMEKIR